MGNRIFYISSDSEPANSPWEDFGITYSTPVGKNRITCKNCIDESGIIESYEIGGEDSLFFSYLDRPGFVAGDRTWPFIGEKKYMFPLSKQLSGVEVIKVYYDEWEQGEVATDILAKAPELCAFRVVGKCQKLFYSNGQEVQKCPKCGIYQICKSRESLRPDSSTWDGSDIFQIFNDDTYASAFITEKALKILKSNGFTNFNIVELEWH